MQSPVVHLLPLDVKLVQQEIEMSLGNCLPEGNPLDKGARQIIDKVMNGGAFKNPLNDADAKNAVDGLLGDGAGWPDEFEDGTDPAGLQATLTSVQSALKLFNDHTKKISGTGDVGDFSRIMGIAGSYNQAKATVEKSSDDNFSGMFSSIIDGGSTVDLLKSKAEEIAIELGKGAGADGATVSSLVDEATALQSTLTNLKNADEAAYKKGFA